MKRWLIGLAIILLFAGCSQQSDPTISTTEPAPTTPPSTLYLPESALEAETDGAVRVYPLGTDDAHKIEDMGGAWIMVGAEKLEYGSVVDALEKGDFYMSCGPEIFDLTIEGNTVKITCSDAASVSLSNHGRLPRRVTAEAGKTINEAAFDIEFFFIYNKIFSLSKLVDYIKIELLVRLRVVNHKSESV